jgi:hypothetical protein
MSPMHTGFSIACACALAGAAHAAGPGTAVQFSRCAEFVGVAAADAAGVRALVPLRYTPVVDGAGAKLVVRVADCEAVRVGGLPARPGRVAQIGVIIFSPDGTGTDPNTSINNYTLSYATDSAALALLLRAAGVPAALDPGLTIESTPAGAANEFYAAVSPDLDAGSPTWFLHGTVNTPVVGSPFLANWWRYGNGRETKMATDIPFIAFDFGSVMAFTTSRHNLVGRLLPGNQVNNFQITFRGVFAEGRMTVTTAH